MESHTRTNAGLDPQEAIVDEVNVLPQSSTGCQKTGTDFMIAFQVNEDPRRGGKPTFYDMFLSEDQLRRLLKMIETRLREKQADESETPGVQALRSAGLLIREQVQPRVGGSDVDRLEGIYDTIHDVCHRLAPIETRLARNARMARELREQAHDA